MNLIKKSWMRFIKLKGIGEGKHREIKISEAEE